MHLLVTRSAVDAASLEAKLADLGHETSSSPLIEIEAVPQKFDLADVQALVVTSRNALRCIGSRALDSVQHLPVFVVGPATGKLARELGFQTVVEGPAAARDLPAIISKHSKPQAGVLLQITGEDPAFDMDEALSALGYRVRQSIVYRAKAADRLDPQVVEAISSGKIEGVILMSPRTATIFSDLAVKAGIMEPASRLAYFCLSDAVAGALQFPNPVTVMVAPLPNLQEMLALLAHEAPSSR